MKKREWHDFYSKPVTLPEFVRWMNNRKVYLSTLTRLLNPGDKILEAGCGLGIDGVYLSHLKYKVKAVDNNEKVLKLAKHHNNYFHGSVEFDLQDIFNLNFKEKEFKVSFSQGVLEHFNPIKIKKALKEQLRVADYVLFSVPSINMIKISGHSKSFGDENYWLLYEWLKIIKDFNLVDYNGYGFNRTGRLIDKFNKIILKEKFKKFVINYYAQELYFLIADKNL